MKATIYSGVSIEHLCEKQLHPVNEILKAKNLIDSGVSFHECSNSTDFISTIKWYGERQGYECEFFLNGESHGSSIEEIFEDFNRSLKLLEDILD